MIRPLDDIPWPDVLTVAQWHGIPDPDRAGLLGLLAVGRWDEATLDINAAHGVGPNGPIARAEIARRAHLDSAQV
jgi:hypothetical protein